MILQNTWVVSEVLVIYSQKEIWIVLFVSNTEFSVKIFLILLHHSIFISNSVPVKIEDVLDKQTRPEQILSMATSFSQNQRDKIPSIWSLVIPPFFIFPLYKMSEFSISPESVKNVLITSLSGVINSFFFWFLILFVFIQHVKTSNYQTWNSNLKWEQKRCIKNIIIIIDEISVQYIYTKYDENRYPWLIFHLSPVCSPTIESNGLSFVIKAKRLMKAFFRFKSCLLGK